MWPKKFMGGQNKAVITVWGEGHDNFSVPNPAKTLFKTDVIKLASVVRLTPHLYFLENMTKITNYQSFQKLH